MRSSEGGRGAGEGHSRSVNAAATNHANAKKKKSGIKCRGLQPSHYRATVGPHVGLAYNDHLITEERLGPTELQAILTTLHRDPTFLPYKVLTRTRTKIRRSWALRIT